MNKRQAKKAYKKKYGHNPPKKGKSVNPKTLEELATAVIETVKPVFEQMIKVFERIKEEFEKINEDLMGWNELAEEEKAKMIRRYAIEERSKETGRASIQVAEALAQKRRKERRQRRR